LSAPEASGRPSGVALVVLLGLGAGFGGAWLWQEFSARRDPIARPLECPAPADDMVRVEGGLLRMGSEDFRAEEAPIREVAVGDFWIDRHHVTNAQFWRFVEATGHVTVAERPGSGSFVFVPPREIHDLRDIGQWWRFVPGATWRMPQGPGSDLVGRDSHPVVHVAPEDAEAYAAWLGHRLPSEAEWEFAARGGLDGAAYVWGDAKDSEEAPRAHVWRGVFPHWNRAGGAAGTAPVGCYPPNGFGLHDMAGNVWHWTSDVWRAESPGEGAPGREGGAQPSRVIKGGSFLCADNFCARYRPAARQPGDGRHGASHIGFRTARD
jgi:formylglycine-generating enzyme required for sulfatase activity